VKVRFAALAREDLNRLIDPVAAIDPERALRLNNGFNVAVGAIAMAPFRCPQVSGSTQIGIRKRHGDPTSFFSGCAAVKFCLSASSMSAATGPRSSEMTLARGKPVG